MLRRTFGPKRVKIREEYIKPNNEELIDLYSPPNIVRVIKERRIRWAAHVARMRKIRDVYRVCCGNLRE